jgi:transcriptional regulator with XRE-family HTH domain
VPSRRNPIQDATFRADILLRDLGRELRVARLAAGRSQAQVAARLGGSQGWVSLVERGRIPALALSDLARHAAAVGLTAWIRLFPDGRVVLDVPQLALLERFRARLHAAWA